MLGTKKTYAEYVKEVRAKQFGWELSQPTPLDNSVAKAVTSKQKNDKTTDDEEPKTAKKTKSKKTGEKE